MAKGILGRILKKAATKSSKKLAKPVAKKAAAKGTKKATVTAKKKAAEKAAKIQRAVKSNNRDNYTPRLAPAPKPRKSVRDVRNAQRTNNRKKVLNDTSRPLRTTPYQKLADPNTRANSTQGKKVVSRTTRAPSKAPVTPKGRPTKEAPLNKTPAKAVSSGRKVDGTGLKTKRLGPTSKTAKATNPSSKVVGEMRENSRKWARKNANKYTTKKAKENAIKAQVETVGMTGRQRQMYKQALTKEMNQGSKRVRELSERKAMRSQKRDALNSAPSQSLQDMRQSLNNDRNQNLRRSDQIKDIRGRAKKLSADMTDRKAKGTLPKITHKPDNSTYKRAENKSKPPTVRKKPPKAPVTNKVGTRYKAKKGPDGKVRSTGEKIGTLRRSQKTKADSATTRRTDAQRKAMQGINRELGKKPTAPKAPVRSATAKARLRKGNDSARAHAQEMRELNSMSVNERKAYRDRMKKLGNK